MDIQLFKDILSIDSTSSKEGELALYLTQRLKTEHNDVELMPIGDGTYNLLFTWGRPEIMFCTHMDTVPPYIPPVFNGNRVDGRGTCDAKGQIMALYGACQALEKNNETGFGLLLLAGEETSSIGAKHFRKNHEGCEYLIVGEPTDCMTASAAKGTKFFHLTVSGQSCHSGYPQNGRSAVNIFLDFMDSFRRLSFPADLTLGDTTWNIGNLVSQNPKNILSDQLECDIYFRTTFSTDDIVEEQINKLIAGNTEWKTTIRLNAYGGDIPTRFLTFEGIPSQPVAFGSDAPQLTNFKNKILCGPGSILVAHTPKEYVLLSDIEKATQIYLEMYNRIKKQIT